MMLRKKNWVQKISNAMIFLIIHKYNYIPTNKKNKILIWNYFDFLGVMGDYGDRITLAIPLPTEVVEQKKPISFGFRVIFYNGISDVKFGWDDTVDVWCTYEDVYEEDVSFFPWNQFYIKYLFS